MYCFFFFFFLKNHSVEEHSCITALNHWEETKLLNLNKTEDQQSGNMQQDYKNVEKVFLLSYLWRNDALHTALQVAFKHMGLGQLLVPMGR